MPGNVVPFEGLAASQDVASSVLGFPAYRAHVRGGGGGARSVGSAPSVSKFFVPQSPPSGFVGLEFEVPRDGGG